MPFYLSRYLLFAARNKPISWLSLRVYACACIRAYPPRHFLSPPICGGKWKWAGVRLGGRVCVCLCVCVCVNGGSEGGDGGRGDFTCCKEYPRGLLSLSPRYLLFAARNIPRMLPRMRMRPPDYAPTFSPPYTYRGENGHIGACARACVRVCMRMREGGCFLLRFIYPTQAPSPSPLPHRCGKVQNLRFAGLFLCGGVIYQPSGETAGEGGKMGKFG